MQQVLFASDYPHRTSEDNVKALVAYGSGPADLDTIWRGNALWFLPRFQAHREHAGDAAGKPWR